MSWLTEEAQEFPDESVHGIPDVEGILTLYFYR